MSPSPYSSSLSTLRSASATEQARLGCTHTLREILQQPQTWRDTQALLRSDQVQACLSSARTAEQIILTGSGSSLYVGECLAPVLQAALGVSCRAVPAGTLLSDRASVLPPGKGLLVSIARSGNSPESIAVMDDMLAHASDWRHLVITCNHAGKLATHYRDEARVNVLLLDPATNDRSLVMTSSFTNLVLAGSGLLAGDVAANSAVADVADTLSERFADPLAQWGGQTMDALVCLGDGAAHGAAHEVTLKLLEMSAGGVRVMSETFLGLRHGPMAWLNRPSHLLAFLSGDQNKRAFQGDLLHELTGKRLGLQRVVVGENVDPDLLGDEGLAINLPGLYALPEPHQAMIHVLAGQCIALFQCLAVGQQPDAPSQGVLTRVVQPFNLHRGTPA